MQDKRPYNKQGLQHGFWVLDWGDSYYEVNFVNGKLCGLFKQIDRKNQQILQKEYYAR